MSLRTVVSFVASLVLAGGLVAQQQPSSRPQINPPAKPDTPQLPSAQRGEQRRPRETTEADRQRQQAASERRRQEAASGDPDVLLDVPNLSVDEISLEVQNLKARVSLDARLANMLQLTAGADVGIESVKLTIVGVQAEVLLKVRLDNVAQIIDRTLTTIDNNPEIVERLLDTVDTTVGTVGNVANTALQPGGVLSQTVNTLGQTVQRTLDNGNIVERTLDAAGKVVNSRTVGNVTSLETVRETTNAAGQVVRTVRDVSGAVIELILDKAGKVVSSRVASQGGDRAPSQ
jgi:hypothetical protein